MTAKIYESPDGGKTVYVREMGSDEPRRQIYPDLMNEVQACLLYTSPSPRDGLLSRMPSSA